MKTRPNDLSVNEFLNSVADEKRREDCFLILDLMKKVTSSKPRMWGSSIIGVGNYRYKYESGREGDWFLAGFSPRKQDLSLYIMSGFRDFEVLMKKLGKYKTGKACLYIKRIEDINTDVLEALIRRSVRHLQEKYGA